MEGKKITLWVPRIKPSAGPVLSRARAAFTVGIYLAFWAAVSESKSVLFYGPTTCGSSPEVAAALALGADVTVWSATTWSSMTTSDFRQFDSIVFGESKYMCSTIFDYWAMAEATAPVWGPAINGNVIIIGGDPAVHSGTNPAASRILGSSLQFSMSGCGTGLYVSLDALLVGTTNEYPLNFLSYFGSVTAAGVSGNDNTATINPMAPSCVLGSTELISSSEWSNWGNSIHEVFTSTPTGFSVLAFDEDDLLYEIPAYRPYVIVRCTTVWSDPELELSATIYDILPYTNICQGQNFMVVVDVSNIGKYDIQNAGFPVPPFSLAGSGSATLVDGPTPGIPTIIQAGTGKRFTWTFTGVSIGDVYFTTTIYGFGRCSEGIYGPVTSLAPVRIRSAGMFSAIGYATTPTCIGHSMTVSLSITNIGGTPIINIIPNLNVISGTPLIAPVSGASPASLSQLDPGSSASFTWTTTALGPGVVAFSLSITGMACGNTAVIGVAPVTATISDVSTIIGAISESSSVLCVGQDILVLVTVTNTGANAVTNVIPQPVQVTGTGGASPSGGPSPVPPLILVGGASATFTYTFTGTSLGTLLFSLTIDGSDAVCATPIITSVLSGEAFVGTPGLFDISGASPLLVSSGQKFPVTFTVTNTGQNYIFGVSATIFVGPGAPYVTLISGPGGSCALAPGSSTTFTAFYQAVSAPALAVFTATISGMTCGMQEISAMVSVSTIIQRPPILDGSMAVYPNNPCMGDPLLITLTLTNTGGATALGVGATLYSAGWMVNPILSLTGPASTPVVGLAAGAAVTFTWTAVGLASDRAIIWTNYGGVDATSGAAVSGAAGVMPWVFIMRPGSLTITGGAPAAVSFGQAFTVSAVVANFGDADVRDVTPQLSSSTLFSAPLGPVPSNVATLPPFGVQTFIWTVTASGFGTACFAVTVTGDTCQNTGLENSTKICTTIQRPAQLEGSPLTVTPSPACQGQALTIVTTVTNTGEADAANVTGYPSLFVEGVALPFSGPSSVTMLVSGGSVSLTWVYLAAGPPGTLKFTATVTGYDANSGAFLATGPLSSTYIEVTAPGSLVSSANLIGIAALGRTFEVRLTVSNSGNADVDLDAPVLGMGGTGNVQYRGGPVPAGPVVLSPGGSETFTWSFSATGSGSMCFTLSATGLTCGNLPVSTSASACTTIRISPPVLVTPGDWPQYHHDEFHTGTAPEKVCPYLELKWARTLTARTSTRFSFASPSVAAGMVFMGTLDGKLVALDESTGAVLWAYDTGASSVDHAPAVIQYVTGEKVVVIGTPAGLAGLRADTGTLMWTVTLNGGIVWGSPVTEDGYIYAVSPVGVAVAVDALTGTVIWRNNSVGNGVEVAPVLGGGAMFILRNVGASVQVVKLNMADGLSATPVSSVTLPPVIGQASYSPAFAGGRLLVTTDKGNLVILDGVSLSTLCQSSGVNPPVVFTTPAADGNNIYLGAGTVPLPFTAVGCGSKTDMGLWGADLGAANPCLTLHRTYATTGDVLSSPAVIAGDGVFIGVDSCTKGVPVGFTGLDGTGSSTIFQYSAPAEGSAWGAPAIADDRVFFPAVVQTGRNRGDLVLYAFGPISGKPPTGLTVLPTPNLCNVSLCWNNPPLSVCPPVTGFAVFRRPAMEPSPWERVSSTSFTGVASCFTDTSITLAQPYYYKVCTVTEDGNIGTCSDPVVTTPNGSPVLPVLKPIIVMGNQDLVCPFHHPPVVCPTTCSCTSYYVYRSTTPGQIGTTIFVDITATSFIVPAASRIPCAPECYTLACLSPGCSSTSPQVCLPFCEGPFSVSLSGKSYCLDGKGAFADLDWDARCSCSWYVEGWEVYRSSAPAPPMGTLVTTLPKGVTRYTDSAAPPGERAYYRVCAVMSAGICNTIFANCSNEVDFDIPQVYSDFVLTKVERTEVNPVRLDFTWEYADKLCCQPCTRYEVFRSIVAGGPRRMLGIYVEPTVTYYETTATTYCYGVECVSGGCAQMTFEICPPAGGGGEISCPEGLTIVAWGKGYCPPLVWLNWTATESCLAVTGYEVYRATYTGAPLGVPITQAAPWIKTCGGSPQRPIFCYEDKGVSDGVTYYYRVVALTSVPVSSTLSNEVAVTVTPYIEDYVLTKVERTSPDPVRLEFTWSLQGNLCSQPCTTYRVYRAMVTGGEREWLDKVMPDVTEEEYSATTYCYGLECVSGGFVLPEVSGFEVCPSWDGGPSCPDGLTVVAHGAGYCPQRVLLSWTATGSCLAIISGYRIFRATYSGAPFGVPIVEKIPWTKTCGGSPKQPVFCYEDTAVNDGSTYYYRIAAITSVSVSSTLSNEVDVTVPSYNSGSMLVQVDQTAADPVSLGFTWQRSTTFCNRWPCEDYILWRATTAGGPWNVTGFRATPLGSTYYQASVTGYCYSMTCSTTGFVSIDPDSRYGYCAGPQPPQPITPCVPLSILAGGGGCPVTLCWTTTPCGPVLTAYEVFRSTTPSDPFPLSVRGVIVATCFTDTTVTVGMIYYYSVCSPALNICSTEITVAVPGICIPPSMVSVTLFNNDSGVLITWTRTGDSLCAYPCTKYAIYRTTKPGDIGPKIDEVSSTIYNYSDINPIPFEINCYTVLCIRTNNMPCGYSEQICTPYISPPPPYCLVEYSVSITGASFPVCPPYFISTCWKIYGELCDLGIIGYQVFRSELPGVPIINPVSGPVPLTSSCYMDWNVTEGRTYYYRVRVLTSSPFYDTNSPEISATAPVSSTCLIADPFGWCSDAQTPERQRSFPASGPVNDLFGTTYQASGTIGGSVISCAGVIAFGTSKGLVYLLNPDGTTHCTTNVKGSVDYPPVIDHCNRTVWVGTSQGYLYPLDVDCNAKPNPPCLLNSFGAIDVGGPVIGLLAPNENHEVLVTVKSPGNMQHVVTVDGASCNILSTSSDTPLTKQTLGPPVPDCPAYCGLRASCTYYIPSGLGGVCRVNCVSSTYFCVPGCDVIEQILVDCGISFRVQKCPDFYRVCGCMPPGPDWTRTFTQRPWGPALETDGACIIWFAVDSQLLGLACATGETVASCSLPGEATGAPINTPTTIYVPTTAGVVAVDKATCTSTIVGTCPAGSGPPANISLSQVVVNGMRTTQLMWTCGSTVVIINAQPGPPTLLTALPGAPGTYIGWSSPTVSSSGLPVACYNVFRSPSALPGSFGSVPITPSCVGATYYVDPDIKPGDGACYRIQAVDAAGNTGPYSNILCTAPAPAPAVRLALAAPVSVNPGVAFTVTVTALSSGGIIDASYAGTIALTSTDPLAAMPGSVVAVQGRAMAQVVLFKRGVVTISGRDASVPSMSGSVKVAVLCPQTSNSLVFTLPAFAVPGVPFTMTVTAYDKFGKPDTNFKGTVTFGSSDDLAVLPADRTYPATTTQNFDVTLWTPGDQILTVNDTSAQCRFSGMGIVRVEVPVVNPPAGLAANCDANGAIELSWTPQSSTLPLTGYIVFRATLGASFSQVGFAAGPATSSYADVIPSDFTTYFYRISAIDVMGNISVTSNVASCTVAPPSGWPLAAYWTNRQGSNPYAALSSPMEIKWRAYGSYSPYPTGGVVVAGRHVFAMMNAILWQYDLDTGAMTAIRSTPGDLFYIHPEGSPAIVGDKVILNTYYFYGGSGGLFAFDAQDLAPLWGNSAYSFDNSARYLAGYGNVGAAGGLLYIGAGNTLAAFSSTDGSMAWKQTYGAAIPTAFIGGPVTTSDAVYATFKNGQLVAADGMSGSLKWNVPVGNDPRGNVYQPAEKDGRIYVGSGANLLVLDAGTGASVGMVSPSVTVAGTGVLSYAPVIDEFNRAFFFTGGALGSGISDVLHAYDVTPVFSGLPPVLLWERSDLIACPISSATNMVVALQGDYQSADARFGMVTLDASSGTPVQHFEGVPGGTALYPTPQAPPVVEDKIVIRGNSDINQLMMLAPGPGVLPPLSLTAIGGIGTIDLSWGEPPAQTFAIYGYAVYRSSFPAFYYGDPGLEAARVSSTWFTDSTYYGLIPGLTYYYTVKAYDIKGNLSPPSNMAYASDPLVAEMMLPKDDDTIWGNVFVVGTASGSDFAEYIVSLIGPGNSGKKRELARSKNPKIMDTLANWETGKAAHGKYVVELLVLGKSGRQVRVRHTVHVGHDMYLARMAKARISAGNSMTEVVEPRGAKQFTDTVAIRP